MTHLESIADCPPLPVVEGVEFRHCPGWFGYAVTDSGDVWSCKPHGRHGPKYSLYWRKLKPQLAKRGGYRHVSLFRNGKRASFKRIANLVLEAFVGLKPDNMVGCHANDIHTDDRLCNLRWDTQAGNTKDRIRNGHDFNGEKHPLAILSNEDVIVIKEIGKSQSAVNIANIYGVCNSTISSILRGRSRQKG